MVIQVLRRFLMSFFIYIIAHYLEQAVNERLPGGVGRFSGKPISSCHAEPKAKHLGCK
jgi:hypothetical protein